MASKDDNNKATPYAATLNPLAKSDVLVWYLKSGYLYLDSKTIDSGPEKGSKAASKPHPLFSAADYDEGIVLDAAVERTAQPADPPKAPADPFGSCLAITTSSTDRMTYAFAIRDTDKHLCMISPVYSPIASNVADGLGVASCAVKGALTVFYIRKTESGNRIFKCDPLGAQPAAQVWEWQPMDNSQLCAAVMTPQADAAATPFLFFQKATGRSKGIYQAGVTSDDSNQLSHIKSLPSGTTPLATCKFQDSTFLFFLNGDYFITATKRSSGAWSSTFNPLNENGDPIKVDRQSGLAVVADETDDRIVITYKADLEEGGTEVLPCSLYSLGDPLSYPKGA